MYLSLRHGIWYLKYRCPVSNRWQKISAHTRERGVAEAFMRDFNPELRRGSVPHGAASVLTLGLAARDYLNHSTVNHAQGTTVRNRYVLQAFQKFAGTDTAIARITAATLENFKAERSTTLRTASLNIEVRVLKAFFSWLIHMGMLASNPAAGVKQVKNREQQSRALTREQVQELLKHVPGGVRHAMVRLALLTACRRGELCNLKWSDIDWENDELIVRAAHAKSGKSRRVPLAPMAQLFLSAQRSRNTTEYVFIQRSARYYGRRITEREASNIVTTARKAAGLPAWIHFHTLRHTAITMMLEGGADIASVRDIAGHSSLTVTNLYAHSGAEQRRKAVDAINL